MYFSLFSETKEVAFVYALASAAIVHTVATNCRKYKLTYCVNNHTMSDNQTLMGQSPDVDFSIDYAKQMLDSRVDNASLQYKTFVLHNNNIGQMVNMYNDYNRYK